MRPHLSAAVRAMFMHCKAAPAPCRPALACCAGTTSRKSVTIDVLAAIDNTQAVRYTGCTQERMVPVAQLGRALDCGSSGCGFEPHRSPQIVPRLLKMCYFTYNLSTADKLYFQKCRDKL